MAHSRSAVSVSGAVSVRLSQQQMLEFRRLMWKITLSDTIPVDTKWSDPEKNETQNTQEKGVAKINKNDNDGFLSENVGT